MKNLIFLLLFSLFGAAASGQGANDAASTAVDREREQINAERAALEAKFDIEEAACYKKFAVNNCLNAIKLTRREAMTGLKQREVALNDQQRRERAADQLRKTEEKSSPEVLRQAAERRTKALEDTAAREDRSRQKADERINLQQGEAANAAETAGKLKGSRERAQARAERQAEIAGEVQKYNDKQQEVLERKASREQRQREQTKPPAASLPTPN